MALEIGSGITIGSGISVEAGGTPPLIPASSLTVNDGVQIKMGSTIYFWDQTKANQFYAANPSTYYYVEYDGVQTKFDGCTLGAVTPSGPYWGISNTGGTITTGTYLSGATNSRIYY